MVLNLWATWCAPCMEEMPTLARLQRRFEGRIRVVPISVDSEGDREKAQRELARLSRQLAAVLHRHDARRPVRRPSAPACRSRSSTTAQGREVARLAGGADWSSDEAARADRSGAGGGVTWSRLSKPSACACAGTRWRTSKRRAAMWADERVTRFIGGKPSTREDSWRRFMSFPGHWALLGYRLLADRGEGDRRLCRRRRLRQLQARPRRVRVRRAGAGLGAYARHARQGLRDRSAPAR